MDFEDSLKELIKRGHELFDNVSLVKGIPFKFSKNYMDYQKWLNDVEIFKDNNLKNYSSVIIMNKLND